MPYPKFYKKNFSLLYLAIFLISLGATALPAAKEGAWARKTLKKLTLRQKISQMMVTYMSLYFMNNESPQWLEMQEQLKTDGVGGLHLWYGEAGMSLTMLNDFQKMSAIPILVDADLERGVGQRFRGGTTLPPLMAVAATGNPEYAYEAGRITALEGRAVGIHFNFSPVVDVNNNPANPIINVRSYGEDPAQVATFSAAFIKGMKDHGMHTTAKHFPGHGDTQTDSHSNLAAIPSDSSRLWQVEIPPFQAAIDAGVDAIMVAHVNAPDYQPHAETPATLSRFWIQDVLRGQLGFEGAVVTDAMGMGGVTQNYSDRYALIEAIRAGADIILQNHDLKTSIDVVEAAVKEGLIGENRINEAAYRMLLMKERLGLHKANKLKPEETRAGLGLKASREKAAEIASRSITLVRDVHGLVPLTESTEEDTLHIIDLYDSDYRHNLSGVTRRIMATGHPVKVQPLDASDGPATYAEALEDLPENARILINAFVGYGVQKDRIFLPDHQAEFVQQVLDKSSRVIVASLGTPYLIQAFPDAPTYLCAWNSSGVMQWALAQAVLGEEAIGGRLPITIPEVAPIGTGLDRDTLYLEPRLPEPPLAHLMRIRPEEVGADIGKIPALLDAAVADSAFPGGVLLAARNGQVFIHQSFGYHTYDKQRPVLRGDIFDLASISKVAGTAATAMLLHSQGELNLDDPVVKHIPRFRGPTRSQTRLKSQVTLRHLLTHTSGLPAYRQLWAIEGNARTRLDSLYATALDTLPGTAMVYSDLGMILMGKVVESIAGRGLDSLAIQEVYTPLGMRNTYYNPPVGRMKRIVPTEYSKEENSYVRGHVHDENAHSLNGVAGHAGIFSTAADLAIFAQTMLNGGTYRDSLIFTPETVDLFTSRGNVIEGSSRALGWDTPEGEASAGIYASDSSFGHTGFTGTSMWIDPRDSLMVILLTNAVHPHREWKYPKYFDWRQKIHSAVYECLPGAQPNPALKLKDRWLKD